LLILKEVNQCIILFNYYYQLNNSIYHLLNSITLNISNNNKMFKIISNLIRKNIFIISYMLQKIITNKILLKNKLIITNKYESPNYYQSTNK